MIDRTPQCAASAALQGQSKFIFEGAKMALPIILGYLPVGLAYGALAGSSGLTIWETVLMSVFVYAGSAQFVAIALLAAGAGPLSITVTTFFVNLRHLLMSAALSRYFRGYSNRWLAWFGAELTDESFAIHSARFRQDPATYQPITMLAVNGLAHLGWIIASLGGFLLQKGIADPGKYGLDFALPAMFIALLFMQLTKRLDLLVAAATFILSVGLGQVLPVYWAAILAAVCGAFFGAIVLWQKEDEQCAGK
ncbi:MAG: AzlC family ABC transporter permease [Firmicutes bacterium]|nr:AzlC family ABC transporter permease [Bacillota bacterium]